MKRYALLTVLVLVFLAGSVFLRLMAIQSADKPKNILQIHQTRGVPVVTTVPRRQAMQETLDLIGTIMPFRKAEVAARRGDEVTSSTLTIGRFVRKGEVVMQLYDRYARAQRSAAEAGVAQTFNVYEKLRKGTRSQQVRELEAAVRSAEAQLSHAEKEFSRMEGLQKTGAITRQNADRIVAAREQATAGLEAARQRLNLAREGAQTEDIRSAEAAHLGAKAQLEQASLAVEHSTIIAPFDGFIEKIFVEPGEQVGNGKPLFALVDSQQLFLRLEVPQSYIHRIVEGQSVQISFDNRPERPEGKVAEISPNADPLSRTFLVKVLFDNPDFGFKPGIFAHAAIVLEDKPSVLAVPRGAVVERKGERGVFLVEENKALFRAVQTGLRDNEFIELATGVTEQTRVVSAGQSELENGSLVEVQVTQ
jgi:multidrug efflux pump subunit AcrA (membrane-fusion protein)